jgi:VanZ family protein
MSLILFRAYLVPPVDPGRGEGTEPLASAPPIWRKPHFLAYWLPPLLWGLAVLSLSGDVGSDTHTRSLLQRLLAGLVTLDPAQIDLINFCLRKTGHALAYGFMYFLWFRALRGHADWGPWRARLWSLGFCLLYASADEGVQWFHASRGASVYDVLLDMSGAGLAALITAAAWTPGPKTPPHPG